MRTREPGSSLAGIFLVFFFSFSLFSPLFLCLFAWKLLVGMFQTPPRSAPPPPPLTRSATRMTDAWVEGLSGRELSDTLGMLEQQTSGSIDEQRRRLRKYITDNELSSEELKQLRKQPKESPKPGVSNQGNSNTADEPHTPNRIEIALEGILGALQRPATQVEPPTRVSNRAQSKLAESLCDKLQAVRQNTPDEVLEFLKAVYRIVKLKLVPFSEIVMYIYPQTTGRMTEAWEQAMTGMVEWAQFRTFLLRTLIPERTLEDMSTERVTRCYQQDRENLGDFVQRIKENHEILGL